MSFVKIYNFYVISNILKHADHALGRSFGNGVGSRRLFVLGAIRSTYKCNLHV